MCNCFENKIGCPNKTHKDGARTVSTITENIRIGDTSSDIGKNTFLIFYIIETRISRWE
jgi:hypothetical protein